MPKIKDGFEGQRVISIPGWFLKNFHNNPLIQNLYITRIGYFPGVKFHYVNKGAGTDYNMLIYCTKGEGWYEVGDKRTLVKKDSYIILPKNLPYRFGASIHNPWTIYWLHFKGDMAAYLLPGDLQPREIGLTEESRVHDRVQIFEEMYANLEDAFNEKSYIYACSCLYHFIASFTYAEQFQKIRAPQKQKSNLIDNIIYFMRENIERKLTLEALSKQFNYSVSHLSAIFHASTGHSPIDYFIRLKIQKACQFLELTNMKVSQVHASLGFDDAAYFSRSFKKIMGVSPKTYRKNSRM
ncbi:MAG: AraC family transcriptional regulator [Bacteroidales bacterium]|nr:AraC family transcriptional regulator [Bacteroidales bacterium]